ncbi:hypothetical protein KC332_g5596 [Hortaea werneckii]|uniref:Uncharacterized protein n=1 Tax=Hortaea werneckii TaxID=91943 RepID=A0A3M7IQH7_HORWE|nr:hypothetical protein KC358_g5456 [Hortaea werneckii]KAI6846347.1 hypothetical protein KC350_g3967 [Hortaea werneckii]KAI6916414.1 hypothetical protein KC348_g11586 [Hortaea werneckii]KAI6932953.1 hypothetical protein KC341_g8643 [Hortaea werneckii]KAI6963084.1 hypothetical protein KC321_g11419 [Hortaea werneckii]
MNCTLRSPPIHPDNPRALTGNWRCSRSPSPPHLASSPTTKNLSLQDVELGLLAHLDLRTLPGNSIVHAQPWVNAGATDHPLFIVGRKTNGNVTVCQVTSFGGERIQAKIPREDHIGRRLALAIQFRDETTAHNNLPILQLKRGNMMKQSYVKLEHFFEIEPTNLKVYCRNGNCLDQPSLDVLHQHMRDVLSGKTPHMPRKPTVPFSPLHARHWTPEEIGIPPQDKSLSTLNASSINSRDFVRAVNTAAKSHQLSNNNNSYRGAVSRVSSQPYRNVPKNPPAKSRDLLALKSWRRTSGSGIRKVTPVATVAH